MNYKDVRNLIKTGDIFSCSGTAMYSKLIKAWTHDEITHTGIAVWVRFPQDEIPDRLCILQAHIFKGVQLGLLSNVLTNDYWKYNGKVYWQKLNNINGDNVASFALANWSKAYPSLYQFVIAGSKLVQAIRTATGRSLNINPEKFHCSELATRALIDAGFYYAYDPAVTTPSDVSKFSCLGPKVLLEPCPKSNCCDSDIWRPAPDTTIRNTQLGLFGP